jgi:hypothetical protein
MINALFQNNITKFFRRSAPSWVTVPGAGVHVERWRRRPRRASRLPRRPRRASRLPRRPRCAHVASHHAEPTSLRPEYLSSSGLSQGTSAEALAEDPPPPKTHRISKPRTSTSGRSRSVSRSRGRNRRSPTRHTPSRNRSSSRTHRLLALQPSSRWRMRDWPGWNWPKRRGLRRR